MSELDFEKSTLPAATPLRFSHAANEAERELRDLFCELFSLVATDTFNVTNAGAAHLGSFDFVRRMITQDGLVLLRGEREQSATRYLYRAWRSGDVQKRGLHFLRTYLQLLFPNQTELRQLSHWKDVEYGKGYLTKLEELAGYDANDVFLTSKIEMRISSSVVSGTESGTSGLTEILRSVVPARLSPTFIIWVRFTVHVNTIVRSRMKTKKRFEIEAYTVGLRVTDHPDRIWRLGRNNALICQKLRAERVSVTIKITKVSSTNPVGAASFKSSLIASK
ncbi:MAG: hypothetical protein ACRCWB_11480 [Enterovibrio sp.]